jgi:hypothetical protein
MQLPARMHGGVLPAQARQSWASTRVGMTQRALYQQRWLNGGTEGMPRSMSPSGFKLKVPPVSLLKLDAQDLGLHLLRAQTME